MKWKLEKRLIKDLRQHARNPRKLEKHDAEHLKASIKRFGQCEPLVINSDDTVIGGHQRMRTLQKLGYKEVDVYVPDEPLTDREVDELNIRLNRNNGSWDFDMLANAWELDDLFDWGFTEGEFGLGEEAGADAGASDDPDAEAPPALFKIEVGNDERTSFENQLDDLLVKFPTAKKKVK